MDKPRYRAVFVSPHLDDAVLSCGGTIARLTAEGPVLVLNVFSRFPSDVHRGPVVIEQGRHAEEASASRLLGFSSECLDEVDAALRHDAYRRAANLFRPPVAADLAALGTLSANVMRRLAATHYDALYLPLGVGWHVDHVLCHAATEGLRGDGRVSFYEDAPYCLVPGFTRYRLRELATVDDGDLGYNAGSNLLARNWYEVARYYAGTAPLRKIRPRLYAAAATAVVSVFLWRLLSRHQSQSVSKADTARYRLRPRLIDISAHFSRKLDACYQYESQVKEFFASREDCETRYRGYSDTMSRANIGGDAPGRVYERFWEFMALNG